MAWKVTWGSFEQAWIIISPSLYSSSNWSLGKWGISLKSNGILDDNPIFSKKTYSRHMLKWVC